VSVKRTLLVALSVAVVMIGFAAPVSATEPATGGGTFTLTGIVTTGARTSDGNLFVAQILTYNDTGLESGIETDDVSLVFHPDGTFNARADVQFVGTFAGRSGTFHQHFEATGDSVSFRGQLQSLGGTGELVNLHAAGDFVGSTSTLNGTYTLHYHFDP